MRIQQRCGWRRSGFLAVVASGLAFYTPHAARGDEKALEKPAEIKPSRLEGLEIQPGDEPLKTFQPAHPPDPRNALRGEALARFMTGRIQQENGNFSAALDSYLAAIKSDPDAIEPYQSALPILLQRQENEEARKLVLDAAARNPQGYELVLAMAAIYVRQDKLTDGFGLIKAAMELPGHKPNSVEDLLLHRDLGLYSRLRGDFKEAAREYEIVFKGVTNDSLSDPDRKKLLVDPGQMFDEFGDTFLKAENPELALKAFEEASKYREARPGLNSYNLATVFRQTGNPQKALEELQGYFDAQLQTRGRSAYELLKSLLADLKREEELIPKLEELLKKDEHNDALRYFVADELLARGDIERAKSLYLNGRTDVTDPRALVGMFSVYRQQKDYEKLLGLLGKVFATVPRAEDETTLEQMAPDVQELARRFDKEVKALTGSKEDFAAFAQYAKTQEKEEESKVDFLAAYLLGKLAAEGDFSDDALHFYKLAISMRNDPPAALYREVAIHLIDANRYEDAIEILNQARSHTSAQLKRDRWNFLYLLSFAYATQGDTEKALDSIREAQAAQPNQPLLHYQEAWVMYHARNWEQALALFEKFIKTYPNDKSHVQKCRFHISNIYVEMGDMARGEQILEDVLASDPENAQANNDLGYLYADQGKQLERAEKMIRKALAKEPDNRAYQDSLGWVLFRLGKYEEALVELEKATSDSKNVDATLMEHLGDCLEKLGRQDDAVAAWKKGLESEQEKKVPNAKVLKSLKTRLKIPEETPAADTPKESAPE